MLTRLGLITKGRINNGLANKKAADARAKALASTIRALQAKGLVSFSAIARELNEREIPTALAANGTQSALAAAEPSGAELKVTVKQPTSTLGPFFCPWN